jgi:hypothetical protein
MYKRFLENSLLIFVIIGIAIVFLLGRSCGKNRDSKVLLPKIDTVVTHTIDTVFNKDTLYLNKFIFKYVPKHDTMWVPLDSVDCNNVLTYNDTIVKKEYDLYTQTTIQGILRSQITNVKLKVPLVIYDNTSTVIKKDSIIYLPSKYSLHGGLLVSTKMLSPVIMFSTDRVTYTLGYDPFNKTPILGYSFRIWGSKKK